LLSKRRFSGHGTAIDRSLLEHLVALLPPLQTLDTSLVHLLLHLGKPFPFFLCGALRLDCFNSSLLHD